MSRCADDGVATQFMLYGRWRRRWKNGKRNKPVFKPVLLSAETLKIHFGYCQQRFGDGLPAELAVVFNAIAKADG
jgi:hypothetical protein